MNPTYSFSFTAARDAGITAAREAYNAACTDPAAQFADNQSYLAFVLDRATESYCRQYGLPVA